MRKTPLRWTSQEPTEVATASQIAAPRDGEASFWFAREVTPLGLPGARERGGSLTVRSPVRDGEAFFWSAYDTIPLDPPGAHARGNSFAVRAPQGRKGFILICA